MIDHKRVREAERVERPPLPFINTCRGNRFVYTNMDKNVIEISEIAHALSHLCRFTGHTNMFWSVAQHSLLVAEKMPGTPEEKLVALLHDSAEAYTNDISSPLKAYLLTNGNLHYQELQDEITAIIYSQYGVTLIPEGVRVYDRAACLFEAQGFMGLSVARLRNDGFPMELYGLWCPWNPVDFARKNSDREFSQVEAEFLKRFEDLMKACNREELL